MKLYVTRHGETPMNAAHRVCGLTNIDLTEKGIAQAKEAGRSLQDKGIKRIIASPLLRAQHTARLIADEIGIDTIETEQRLRRVHSSIMRTMWRRPRDTGRPTSQEFQ